MSGLKSYSFREGDRSEYLAQFLLSGLGLCTPIPRPEDIGVDFVCSLADQESGMLTFGFPYLISIKSISSPSIVLEPSATVINQSSSSHVDWLFCQELPILLGVVDKKALQLQFFSLLPVWFLYYQGGPSIGCLALNPRPSTDEASEIGPPLKGAELQNWPGHFRYDVDLGHPIAVLDYGTLQDEEATRQVKRRLRFAVGFAQKNLLHRRLKIPHFYWFASISPKSGPVRPAFSFQPVPPDSNAREAIMGELAPSLISFAMHFKEVGDAVAFEACANLISHAAVPKEVLEKFPELRKQSAPISQPATLV